MPYSFQNQHCWSSTPKRSKWLSTRFWAWVLILDLSEVFDTSNHDIPLVCLKGLGMEGIDLQWVFCFFHGWLQVLVGEKRCSSILCGVVCHRTWLFPLLFHSYLTSTWTSEWSVSSGLSLEPLFIRTFLPWAIQSTLQMPGGCMHVDEEESASALAQTWQDQIVLGPPCLSFPP